MLTPHRYFYLSSGILSRSCLLFLKFSSGLLLDGFISPPERETLLRDELATLKLVYCSQFSELWCYDVSFPSLFHHMRSSLAQLSFSCLVFDLPVLFLPSNTDNTEWMMNGWNLHSKDLGKQVNQVDRALWLGLTFYPQPETNLTLMSTQQLCNFQLRLFSFA